MRQLLLRVCAVALSVLASTLAVHAEETGEARALLEKAIETAFAHAGDRFAFTVSLEQSNEEETVSLELRYDPREPEKDRWRLLGASDDGLSKKEKKVFKKIRKSEFSDDAIVYDKLGEELSTFALISETEEAAVFSSPVVDDDLPEGALEMYVTLDKKGGHVSRIEVRSLKPFKPASVAKIETMSQVQTYRLSEAGGPALLHTSESAAEGSAMFKSFKSHSRQTFSDIERIDAEEIVED